MAISRILWLTLLIPGIGCAPAVLSAPADSAWTAEDSVHLDVIALHARAEEWGVVLLSDSTHGLVRPPSDTTGLTLFGALVTDLSPDLLADFREKVENRVALNPEVIRPFAPRIRTRGSLEHPP